MAQLSAPRVGERTFANGTVYQGEVADVRVPVGCVTKPHGSRYLYAGETRFAPTGPLRAYVHVLRFVAPPVYYSTERLDVGGFRRGTGSAYFHNGGRYEGNWLGDVQQDNGWSLTPGGEIYIGKWAAGERNGCGVMVSCDGDVYYGDIAQDAPSGWGAQQTVDWDETGETIIQGRWELGKCTRKRFRGGVEYMLPPGRDIPASERDLVQKSVRKAQSQVAVAIGQVQASFRAQMRADDAQLRAMGELDEAADDGTAQELKAFHSKAEANAVEALAGARLRGESGAYLDMANASIQAGIVEHRIHMAMLMPRDHKRWEGIADVCNKRAEDLRRDLRRLRKLAHAYREQLRQAGMAEESDMRAFESAHAAQSGARAGGHKPKARGRPSVLTSPSALRTGANGVIGAASTPTPSSGKMGAATTPSSGKKASRRVSISLEGELRTAHQRRALPADTRGAVHDIRSKQQRRRTSLSHTPASPLKALTPSEKATKKQALDLQQVRSLEASKRPRRRRHRKGRQKAQFLDISTPEIRHDAFGRPLPASQQPQPQPQQQLSSSSTSQHFGNASVMMDAHASGRHDHTFLSSDHSRRRHARSSAPSLHDLRARAADGATPSPVHIPRRRSLFSSRAASSSATDTPFSPMRPLPGSPVARFKLKTPPKPADGRNAHPRNDDDDNEQHHPASR